MTLAIARNQTVQNLAPSQGCNKRRIAKRGTVPEYLEVPEIEALMRCAGHASARLLMLIQWRAGLRISETLGLEVSDLALDTERPTLKVREGKGKKDRVVPVHPELAGAFRSMLAFGGPRKGRLFEVSRSTGWRWVSARSRRHRALI